MFKKALLSLLFGVSSLLLSPVPIKAAEEILISYSSLVLSIKVESLEKFAQTGEISEDLKPYFAKSSPEKKEQFRQALNKRVDTNPVLISRFFNTAMGEAILERFGKGITIQGGGNGKYALRGAIVTAALDKEEGLTLINVFRQLPVNIQIQGELALGLANKLHEVIEKTERLVQEMRTLTAQEAAATTPVNYQALPDLRQPGKYQVKKEVWKLVDSSRDRSLYVDIYIPQTADKSKIPVVIFSHGLASRPEDFEKGLRQLASYGYFIAAPQHPGSDIIYLQEMFQGFYENIFDVNDFINRPKDISFIIDELERRNPTQFQGRLELKNVGAVGHSFGGYTVLALAGATIDFEYLQQECQRPYNGLNLAILMQCRALELPRKDYNFRDERVAAVFAANPVNRSIFGKKGVSNISIPVMLGSGSYDPAAPPVFEQSATFVHLTSPNKYWLMVEGQAHVNFSELDAGITKALDSVDHLTLPSQQLIGSYVFALTTPFFQVHLRNDPSYLPYLQSGYALYLSEGEKFKVSFISKSSVDSLASTIEKYDLNP